MAPPHVERQTPLMRDDYARYDARAVIDAHKRYGRYDDAPYMRCHIELMPLRYARVTTRKIYYARHVYVVDMPIALFAADAAITTHIAMPLLFAAEAAESLLLLPPRFMPPLCRDADAPWRFASCGFICCDAHASRADAAALRYAERHDFEPMLIF